MSPLSWRNRANPQKEKRQRFHECQQRNQVPKNKGDCATPIGRNIALAGQLNISGTPALIFEDGRLIPGAISPEQIEKNMQEATARLAEKKTKEAEKK